MTENRGPDIDILTATARDLRRMLENGKTTSVQLVKLYLAQIAKHNHHGMRLNAIIETASLESVLKEAEALDVERASSVRDLICTSSFGMGTTAGSLALKGLQASTDATIAVLLREASCIVIGKSNLSEWGNSKGLNVTSGWSAAGGQTLSPYVRGGIDSKDRWMGHSAPAGSSSGSAVATAAGFSPLSIGTEAGGSIVQPAVRAALYSMKGTVGDVPMVGTQSGGAAFDSPGPMAKCVEDCADVMDVLLPGRGFFDAYRRRRRDQGRSWQGIRIACLDYDAWQFPDSVCEKTEIFDVQHKMAMYEALKKAGSLGAKVAFNAPLMSVQEVKERYNTVTQSELATDADVIMASGESTLTTIAANAGYPIASVPLGFAASYNGRPFGMDIMARNGEEARIFDVMAAWEATFTDARGPPPLLVEWE
ncbi:amidase signature domain-containing protein [Xylariaceae sp. FL0594]|nr:amidase signature domain-containing protein [Xylariaceae sp. FL0594]